MGRGIIAMSVEEAKRLHVVRKVLEKQITQAEAADLVGICLRQFQRVVRRVRAEGDSGICHRARGRRPNNRISERVKARIIALCRRQYREFGPTLASEKLLEKNRLKVSTETLRTWLLEA